MSTPDPNSSASLTVSTASETPAPPANTVRTITSQPPPAPPPQPQPPSYRALAPLQQHANPLQQTHHNNLPTQSIPNRRPNTPHQPHHHHHHQDPSTVLYPFPPGRGFSVRPARMNSPGNQSGYPIRPGLAYGQRQFGPNEMETMMQFMRARNPQIHHQLSHPGSGSPVGSGPMRGVPHFLQPRVAPPPTSILETGRNKNARRRDALVLVRGRKVRITDGASLYSLSRSWLRNGAHEGVQSQRSDTMKPLPKPLPVDVVEAAVPNDPTEKPTDEDKEDEESVEDLTEKDLLKGHIERAKKVRARLREERLRKIARYKGRLALLLPQSGEQCMKND
ncbi:unnamed protein product [Eruca vesicaria subsp. sativa]|uniref:Uncharacterized protein n=1 Tax=Eruca vesicaria subsp. sativa TaxID=29727 RepID=A0ABC8IQ37_ERUVS|nr:unnamed protein product [Eruca vesicaria subsp. sativa]